MDVQRRKAKCFIIVIATIMAFCAAQVIEADEVVSTELVGVEDTGISQNNLSTETEMPGNIEIVQDEEPEDVEGSNVQDIIVEEMEFDSDEIESDIMSQEMTEGLLDDEENIQQGTEKDVDSELAEISLGEDGLEVDLSGMINPAPVSLTIYDMLGTWEGRYCYEADNEAECTFLLNISDCTDDGQINGYAEIGTQKVTGFFFDGAIDFQSGSISFAVTEWMDNPQDSAVEIFSGTVDLLNMEMSGIVNSDENSSFKLSKALDDYGVMMMRSDVEEEEIPDYDIWLANTLISGFENDGNGLYRVFRNTFGEPVYSLMGAHLMEDEPLVIISTAWSVYLNSEYRNQFANEQKYIYEVLLMEYLKYDSNSSARKIDLYNNEMKFSIKLFSAITKGVSGSRKDHLNSMTPEEALRFYDNLDWADDLSPALSELKTGYSTVKELINGISEYKALEQVRNERVALLKAARDACASSSSPNRDFIQAVNELINMIEGSKLQYIQGKSMDYLLEQDLNFLWGQLCNANPVLSGIEFGISGLDMCFDSTNRASNDLKLALLYTVDQYMKMGMMNASTSYLDEKTSKNAQTFIACFEAYVQFQMYGNKFISTWLNDYLDGGIFSDIINMVFYQENIQTAEELLALAKSQTENREHLLGRISDWADLYEGLYKPDEWDDFQLNVPVTGVTFSEPSYTIGKSDGVLVHAQIQPENATNKNIIYSSSDPAILEVSSGGGFATVHGTGTVTVTARTEEGGYIAYQNIIIEDRTPLLILKSGLCGEVGINIKYGDNAKWRLYSNGTLFIYGHGIIGNRSYAMFYVGAPWEGYEDKVLNVVMANGITEVPSDFFINCNNVTSIKLSDTLKKIGGYACAGCANLKKIDIPDGVNYIGSGAFRGCKQLENVNLPKSLTKIENGVFEGCTNLDDVNFPDGLKIIGEEAFVHCESLKRVNLPEGMTSIENYAFRGCSNLNEVILQYGLVNIDEYAFQDCTSLKSVKFPEGLQGVGSNAFENCSSLNSVEFLEGLQSVGRSAFGNCSSLNNVSLPESLTSIGSEAFVDCSSLSNINLPESLTKIEWAAFRGCSSLSRINLPKSLMKIENDVFCGCSSLENISLPESLTSIGSWAFWDCSSLSNINLPESLTSIGIYAFEDCSRLSNINLPERLTSIKEGVFSGCSSLNNVILPRGLMDIAENAFEGCSSLNSVVFPDGLKSIGFGAFLKCNMLQNVYLPESITDIGNWALGFLDDYLREDKIEGFTIYGKRGSVAEKYANKNGFIFCEINETDNNLESEVESDPQNKETETKLPQLSDGSHKSPLIPDIMEKGKSTQLSAEDLLPGVKGNSVTWSSSNPKVATVDKNGKVTGKGYGTVTITVAATDGSGRTAQCKLTIGYGIAYKLKGGKNNNGNPAAYYKSVVKLKNPSRKGYVFKGWYTDKKYKKKLTKIKASSKKNLTLYAKWQKIKVGGTRITTLKNQAGKKATLKFKKTSNVTGYEIVYSTDKKFKKNCKTISTKKTSAILKKLEKGKTYFVKVRAYKKDSVGKRVYGKYSALKKVKIKK